ncbi:hypothetical protein E2C01_019453 [Portunus trituberculatus]|uniref:Uncharacterized protein n=1 Tax=Portunus trituberculatus TaxID=210409 RepID=A0A5B7DYX3_PORTR|nr:hypothetical protein [Portunus trituberculatus]
MEGMKQLIHTQTQSGNGSPRRHTRLMAKQLTFQTHLPDTNLTQDLKEGRKSQTGAGKVIILATAMHKTGPDELTNHNGNAGPNLWVRVAVEAKNIIQIWRQDTMSPTQTLYNTTS